MGSAPAASRRSTIAPLPLVHASESGVASASGALGPAPSAPAVESGTAATETPNATVRVTGSARRAKAATRVSQRQQLLDLDCAVGEGIETDAGLFEHIG